MTPGTLLDTVLDRSVVLGYSKVGLAARRRLPDWPDDPAPDALRGRSAMVTGATSGLGTATAAGLARLGARVHLVVRNMEKGERVLASLRAECPGAEFALWRCDVSDLEDVRRFAGSFRAEEERLDVLVHNAGVMPPDRAETPQGHEVAVATHLLGPVAMTEALRPVLGGGRAVLVSSGGMYAQRLHAEDPEYRVGEYSGTAAYARTKRMQIELLPVLSARWSADGIDVHAMHPGWADTPGIRDSLPGFHRLTGRLLRDGDEGADTSIWLAATEPAPRSGQFWHDRRPRPTNLLPWTRVDEDQRARLWQWCVDALGLSTP
ncbi:MAG TPA: SDR family NAD(P)-dependent oxidoreductase [Nocardioidaceae bacterium]|nr:SDR family NAD(P)-dependent oxidoreductase [Nocardioidaceae bacterium]